MDPFDTVWPADSVEFCPHPDATNIFACGTYMLETPDIGHADDDDAPNPVVSGAKGQIRKGKCLIFEVASGGDGSIFSQVQDTPLPAVLDMKWCHTSRSRSPLLGVADAEGNITLHEWDINQKCLNQTSIISCAPSDVLSLSLDWSNRRSPTSTLASLVVSLSNGELALLQPDTTNGLSVTDTWAAHDYEPWIAAWDYWDTSIIYSGGDDLKMKAWDIRQGFDKPFTVNRRFDAGVTTIQSHPNVEHILAVGSYDNTVRIYDNRKLLTPLTQADVGGGAWRVKWHPSPSRADHLLVASMHDGFKVLQFQNVWDKADGALASEESWKVVQRFDKHESLAYGVDWSHAEGQGEQAETLIASASFYDHALHLWKG
ncbi:WD-40 repeat-containing protein [Artomyces pyxidatus]|uniref:WD-40 repeat-containing protein n=1 Tax=Artomyces pyxidatus TaxID=48021 RepID=A0ACB8TIF4_9AGAM|nr:WD-40 repeat-containing protein [Artomyces pyxidatus]